jgi:hypothetical protein
MGECEQTLAELKHREKQVDDMRRKVKLTVECIKIMEIQD